MTGHNPRPLPEKPAVGHPAASPVASIPYKIVKWLTLNGIGRAHAFLLDDKSSLCGMVRREDMAPRTKWAYYCHSCQRSLRARTRVLIPVALLLLLALTLALPVCAAEGLATHYGVGDGYGWQRTASGEVMNHWAMTCASWHYPLGTWLRVTNLANRQSVIVKVNDRGGNHLLDLSYGAFRRIANPSTGVIEVKVEVLK